MHGVLGVGLFAASKLEPGFGFELGVVLWVLMCAVVLAVHVGGSVSEHGERVVAGVFVGLVLMVTVVPGAAFFGA